MAHILCVDDDPSTLALKRAILEQAGHRVTAFLTVEEAIRALESGSSVPDPAPEQTYDAVVTDWHFGQERGQAVVAAAKRSRHVPVVVVSGFVSEAFRSVEPLADIYLEKPADPRELVQVVEALLNTQSNLGSRAS